MLTGIVNCATSASTGRDCRRMDPLPKDNDHPSGQPSAAPTLGYLAVSNSSSDQVKRLMARNFSFHGLLPLF